ncbi:MAG: hypothetical protein IT449_18005 [Phycisphaerales bacterium]|nr:hypothetical protein [Phycisphaerales bacterium]
MARESQCHSCGATIFPEQIDSGLSRYEGGKLMCVHCVEEYERAHDQTSKGGSAYHLDPIALRDEGDSPDADAPDASHARAGSGAADASSGGAEAGMGTGGSGLGMSTGGSGLGMATARTDRHYHRALDPSAAGATRCRTFHCKLNDSAIEFMNHSLNQWLDEHPDIAIKFATSTLGVFEGKSKEQNLILTVFF